MRVAGTILGLLERGHLGEENRTALAVKNGGVEIPLRRNRFSTVRLLVGQGPQP